MLIMRRLLLLSRWLELQMRIIGERFNVCACERCRQGTGIAYQLFVPAGII